MVANPVLRTGDPPPFRDVYQGEVAAQDTAIHSKHPDDDYNTPKKKGGLGSILTLVIAGIIVYLLIFTPMGDNLYSYISPVDDTIEGFETEDLAAPAVSNVQARIIEDKPTANASLRPAYGLQPSWELVEVYPGWGGTMRVWVKNTGGNTLFVYGFGIKAEWGTNGTWYKEDCGVTIDPDEDRYLGLIFFPGPDTHGDYDYNIGLEFMIQRPNGAWYDYGERILDDSSTRTMTVPALITAIPYEMEYNIKSLADRFYEKIDTEYVKQLTFDLIPTRFQGPYNIFQALTIFDYVYNISYVADDERDDHWASPQETLGRDPPGGDCEDHAILLVSMIENIGGVSRAYFTDDHAFSGIYIGNTEAQKKAVSDAIEDYYGTDVILCILKDKHGYWLMSDSGSFPYMGGLPVGAEPQPPGSGVAWDFVDTEYLISVDVKL